MENKDNEVRSQLVSMIEDEQNADNDADDVFDLDVLLTESVELLEKTCNSLCVDASKYDPKKTVKYIKDYLADKSIDRVLYYKFSKFIFEQEVTSIAKFENNLQKLMEYVLDPSQKISSNVIEAIVKIYDHFYLVNVQIENVRLIAQKSAASAREQISSELKGVEKDYISILSIFSAVIMTFFGGFNYIASALSSLNEANMFKSAFAISLSGCVTFNMIYVMIKMIGRLVKHDFKSIMDYDKISNYVYIVNFVLVVAVVVFGVCALYYPCSEQNIFVFP